MVVLLDLAQSCESVRRHAESSESRRCLGPPLGADKRPGGHVSGGCPSGALALSPTAAGPLQHPTSPVTHTPGPRGLRAAGLQTTVCWAFVPSAPPHQPQGAIQRCAGALR